MSKRKRVRQALLEFPNEWGGARKGAGRKPKGDRPGVSHRARAPLAARFPVHVTIRLVDGLPTMRERGAYHAVVDALRSGKERFGFRLVHYVVCSNHLHMVVEAKDRSSLSRAMQGLQVRLARALNRWWRRRGRVFADRYHDRILRTPREVRNVLVYVFRNVIKHRRAATHELDPCSSSRWFDGWKEALETLRITAAAPVAAARTWLLRHGWRRHGLVSVTERPAS